MSKEKAAAVRKGPSTFQFVVLVLIIAVVPPALQQLDIDRDTVKIIGRACAGFVIALLIWGMFTKMIRLVGIILGLVVATSVLVSEGVIKPPKIADKIKGQVDDRR